MRGASIGSGSHGSDVGRFEDEKSSGCGAAAAGCYIDDDRNGRGHNFFDDVAGRFDQSSGSVDLDEDSLVVIGSSEFERAANVFGGYGLDGILDHNSQNVG